MADDINATNSTIPSGSDTDTGDTLTAGRDTPGDNDNAPARADGGFIMIEKPSEVLAEDDARAQAKTAAEGNPGTSYVVARIVYQAFKPIGGEEESEGA